MGQLIEAEKYIQKAVSSTENNGGLSYLNFCAILSQKGNHQKALKMAMKALQVITIEMKQSNSSKKKGMEQTKQFLDNAKLLAISHYNCGAEQEYL